ncbi:peptidoglycan recognition protein family protein [Baia soyae]|uniref:Peptidoglycan hydrolase-like protein with peptidoglycan-binding domain n=1 Tax=Baia soyae TaxID=1544746 RepID=A0A4R2RVX6_9BACL|nr:N-acetylmuramoyl-L-alanine amidase [Baia soyae]TCP68580.1 peptidoglycan hydrolase-like protein with peptidoglycan-binding domain [Baia soyae]
MTWTYGKIVTLDELIEYIAENDESKHPEIHIHHTWKPDHSSFNGANYITLQNGMRSAHLGRGFITIAQHVSLFPDGKFVLGRDINLPPASSTGYNDSDSDGTHPFMVETVGNFDVGHDPFQPPQSTALFHLTAYFVKYRGAKIKFHNEMSSKTCPGSSINKQWFVGEVQKIVGGGNGSNPQIPEPGYTEIAFPGYPIRKGARGPVVGRIQQKVGVKADQIFGPTTEKAVRAWQKAHGLRVDGVVGPDTWKSMFNNSNVYPGKLIRRGSKGDVVRAIQKKLGGLIVDGVFGVKTEVAVKAFQRKKGLAVDGIVGLQTWNVLFK